MKPLIDHGIASLHANMNMNTNRNRKWHRLGDTLDGIELSLPRGGQQVGFQRDFYRHEKIRQVLPHFATAAPVDLSVSQVQAEAAFRIGQEHAAAYRQHEEHLSRAVSVHQLVGIYVVMLQGNNPSQRMPHNNNIS
jgi:hypothetical protein